MYILTNSQDVIMTMGNEVIEDTKEEGVVWVDGAGYGLIGQQIHEVENVPEYVVPDKYKYIGGEFVLNESYRSPNAEIEELKEQIAIQDGAILELAELLGGLLDG